MLDAPVSGGPAGARSGKLAIWVGGDKAVFDKYKSVLDAFSDAARYIGPIGAGSVAKLVHNCAGYAIQTALAEVFALGVKGGVEPLALWEAVRAGAIGRRRTFDGLIDQFLPGKYDPPAFALRLAHKDVSLATQLGRELGVPMRVAELALAEMTEALNRGWEGRDCALAHAAASSSAPALRLPSSRRASPPLSSATRPTRATPSAADRCHPGLGRKPESRDPEPWTWVPDLRSLGTARGRRAFRDDSAFSSSACRAARSPSRARPGRCRSP